MKDQPAIGIRLSMLGLLLVFSFSSAVFAQEESARPEAVKEITVYVDKPYILDLPQAKRALVVDPTIAVANIEPGKVIILAKKRGMTLLLVWTQTQRWVFNLKSEDLVVLKAQEKRLKKEKEIKLMEPLRVNLDWSYTGYYRGGATKSIQEDSRTDDLDIGTSAETPYGYFRSQTRYEKKNNLSAIRHQLYTLEKAKLGILRGGDLAFGDNYYYLSALLYPGNRFWGISYGTLFQDQAGYRLKQGEWRYFFVGGREEEGGAFGLSADTHKIQTDSYHYGLRLDYGLNKNLNFYALGFKHYGKDNFQRRKNAFGGGLNWLGAHTRLNTELGYDGYTPALKMDGKLDWAKLSLSSSFYNIEPNFFSVARGPSSRGTRSFGLSSRYIVFPFLKLSGSLSRSRNLLNPNPNDPTASNNAYSANVEITLPKQVNTTLYFSEQDNEGSTFPTRKTTFGLRANKSWQLPVDFLLGSIFTAGQVAKNKYTSTQNPALDYQSWDFYFDSGLSLKNGFSFNFNAQRTLLEETYTKQKSQPFLWSVSGRYYKQLFKGPLSFSASVSYKDVRDVASPVCYTVKENVFSLSGGIHFKVKSGNISASVAFSDHRPEDPASLDYVEMRFYLGGRIDFDTGIRFSPSCKVRGVVFKDINADGIRDKDEPGIPGIKVFCEKKSAITDKEGRYNLGRVGAKEIDVSLDPQTFPAGYSSLELTKHIEVEQGRRYNLDFAIRSYTKLEGRVFNDVNGNGIFDAEDEGIAGVVIRLGSGDWEKTDRTGYFRFPEVSAGKIKISVDIASLPEGYASKTPIRQEITAEEGKVAKQDFVFSAMHVISGRVYDDSNKNSTLDVDEKGIAGVKINIDTEAVLTDEEGRYLMRDLKVGTYTVSIDEKSLPKGYIIEGEKTKTVKVEKGPLVIRDLNFAVVKER